MFFKMQGGHINTDSIEFISDIQEDNSFVVSTISGSEYDSVEYTSYEEAVKNRGYLIRTKTSIPGRVLPTVRS